MCGLVGAFAYNEFGDTKAEKVRQESMIFFVSELLQMTQTRGKDATGIATLFDDCDYMGLKMGIAAQEFISRFGESEKEYGGYVNIWRKKSSPARIVLGHCRKPSTGGNASPDDNNNNHPIKVGDIVGVHNGTLNNHEVVFKHLGCKRDGNVDSEAIFRLLSHFTKEGTEPFSKEAVLETCKRISGNYAVLSFNGNNPYQAIAFRDGKPLEVALIKPLKLLLVASDKDFLKSAILRYNKMSHLYQIGTFKYAQLKKGDVDMELLTDDSLYLFDVRKDITDKTAIKDLYVSEKVPRNNKIWTKEITTHTSTNTNNRGVNGSYWYNKNGADTDDKQKKAEVTAGTPGSTNTRTSTNSGGTTRTTTSTGSTNKQQTRSGMVWNRDSKQYDALNYNDDSALHGNVEINCEDGEIIDLDSNSVISTGKKSQPLSISSDDVDQKSKLDMSIKNTVVGSNDDVDLIESEEPVDNLITDPAKIEVVSLVTGDKVGVDDSKTSRLLEHLKDKKNNISLKSYPDVLERSIMKAKEQKNFTNDEELMDDLEITNKEAAKSMTTFSLANRVKNKYYQSGWYDGYVTRLSEEGTVDENNVARSLLIRSREKMTAAQETLRNMKIVTKLLSKLIESNVVYVGNILNKEMVDTILKDPTVKGTNINLDVIDKTFKSGDLRDNPILKKILELSKTVKE